MISIHALREEGDVPCVAAFGNVHNFYPRPPRGGRHFVQCADDSIYHDFYPRPPRGGRHIACPGGEIAVFISIHALREEGDQVGFAVCVAPQISIHALREEGDKETWFTGREALEFLSTPSARRATAKTEKNISAFVSL